ncbi:Pycsar system effector family protein [Streptomyces sp. TS71-3]|uniref:Pycsar system effector family protein n=1 Tax=Streptomyces sp. TS71-3 TaxID=2733862 RepID=UPI001B202D3B|nr:Pycsar system effector family protein [Streptomyces sp. TS71-3]GHJ34932.1 hypothetical protein Sm713_05410 [Streptomyces sp. TS71-3]
MRTEIARADAKAAVLVAALGMTAGLFSGLLTGRSWTPRVLSPLAATIWWCGTAAFALSLVALLLTVLPRHSRVGWSPGAPLAYFGDVRRAVRAGLLAEALAETELHPLAGLATALNETSRIASRKHEWIRVGLIAFCVGSALLPTALLIG